MKKFIAIIALIASVTTAQAGTLYRFLSDYCPGRDSVSLTNTLASIGTNLMTLVFDGGPWSISNGVVIPSNIEIIYSRDSRVTLVGTNTIVVNTTRLREDWLTNLNVSGKFAATGAATFAANVDVGGTMTVYKITGDGSGLTGIVVVGTIDYQIDGTSNIVAGTITGPSFANSAVGNAALADGAVTAGKITAGVVGPTQLEATAVSAGTYTSATITVDADGRITAAASTAGSGGIATQSLASVLITGNDAAGGNVTNANNLHSTGTVSAATFVGAGSGVTGVRGSNLTANTVGSAALESTAVTPGTYSVATVAVDADGRVTSASSHAITLTGTIGGGGSTGYTQIGPCTTTNSAVFGPFTSYVGVFTVWVAQSGTGQFQYGIKYADDAGMATNVVTLGTMGDNPDIGADHNQACTYLIPRGKYVRVYCTTAGSSSYYIRYGILEL